MRLTLWAALLGVIVAFVVLSIRHRRREHRYWSDARNTRKEHRDE